MESSDPKISISALSVGFIWDRNLIQRVWRSNMHEYVAAQQILNMVVEEAGRQGALRVSEISVKLGELTGISSFNLREAFKVESKDTIAEGARLDVKKVAGKIACEKCGYTGGVKTMTPEEHHESSIVTCPKCGGPVAVTEGAGWIIESTKLVMPENAKR